jgi:hypothetical protein
METLATPAGIASLIARNLVPAVGVLFLGWSAGNLLVLYYLDTILSFAVVVLLVARHVTGLGKPGERGRPLKGSLDWIKASAGSLLAAVLICLPLGVPLVWTLAAFDWSVSAALADRSFLTGLALQIGGSIYGGIQAHRDLLARTDDDRVLKHRAAFIVARWLVVLAVAFTGVAGFLGPWIGGTLVVLVYAGATVYFELFPDRALMWLNPKEARADADDAARKAKGESRF